MPLTLQKYVVLHNWKLRFVYYVLCLVVFVFFVYRMVETKQYLVRETPTGVLRPWVVERKGDADIAAKLTARSALTLNSTTCVNASLYEYWWDALVWKYGPHTCLPLCEGSEEKSPAAPVCMYPSEGVSQDSSSVFFPTSFSEQLLHVEDNERWYFTTAVEELVLHFEYTVDVKEYGWFSSETRTYRSESDILTVVVQDDKVVQMIMPQETPSFSVSQLLELAGADLNAIQLASANKKPGVPPPFSDGPIARVSGLEMSLTLDCHNTESVTMDIDRDWEGLVCLLKVTPTEVAWSRRFVVESLNASAVRYRRYYGILVYHEVRGGPLYFDLNTFLLSLTTVIVFINLPGNIILTMCTKVLGHLSTLYCHAIYENVDLLEQCSGMAARLMTMSAAFAHLEDMGAPDTEMSKRGISRDRMRERLLQIFRHRKDEVSEDEVERFANFCWYTMITSSRENISWNDTVESWNISLFDWRLFVKEVTAFCVYWLHYYKIQVARLLTGMGVLSPQKLALMGTTSRLTGLVRVHPNRVVTIDDFSVSYSSIERFSFKSFVTLFRKDRRLQVLERFFTPRHLRACLDGEDRSQPSLFDRDRQLSILVGKSSCPSSDETEEDVEATSSTDSDSDRFDEEEAIPETLWGRRRTLEDKKKHHLSVVDKLYALEGQFAKSHCEAEAALNRATGQGTRLATLEKRVAVLEMGSTRSHLKTLEISLADCSGEIKMLLAFSSASTKKLDDLIVHRAGQASSPGSSAAVASDAAGDQSSGAMKGVPRLKLGAPRPETASRKKPRRRDRYHDPAMPSESEPSARSVGSSLS